MIDPRTLRLDQLQTPSRGTLVFLAPGDLERTDARLLHLSRPYLEPADYVVCSQRAGRVQLLPLVSKDIGDLPFSMEWEDRSGYAGLLQGELRAIPQLLEVAARDLERVVSADLLCGSRCRRLGEEELRLVSKITKLLKRYHLTRRSAPLHHLLDPGRN